MSTYDVLRFGVTDQMGDYFHKEALRSSDGRAVPVYVDFDLGRMIGSATLHWTEDGITADIRPSPSESNRECAAGVAVKSSHNSDGKRVITEAKIHSLGFVLPSHKVR